MPSSLDNNIDLRHYGRLIWRRKWIVVLAWVSTVCAALIGLNLLPRQYQSSATLLVQERRPMVRAVERMMDTRVRNQGRQAEEERMTQIVGYIQSRPFLERVVKILKMNEDPRVLEEAKARQANYPDQSVDEIAARILVANLQSRIQIGALGPGLYKFIVRDYDPHNAQLLAKWISELFIDMTMKKELDQIRAARNFGVEQLRVYQEQLRRSEDALERYQASLIQADLEPKLVRASNLNEAEALYSRLHDDAHTAQARLGAFTRAALDTGLPLDDPRLRNDPEVLARKKEFQAALDRVVHEELLGSGGPMGVSNARAALATARTRLYQALETRTRDLFPEAGQDSVRALATYVFADMDAVAQAATASRLKGSIDALKRTARSTPASSLELTRLQNEVKRNRELLESFQAQLTASDLSQALETTDLGLRIEIVDPAQFPLEPSWPNKKKVLVLAILLGPLLGVGFAMLSEMLDPTLRTLEDIQRVAPEPVYATLPLVNDVIARPAGFRRYWVPVTLAGVVLVTVAFFVARATILPNLGFRGNPVQTVEPEESLVP